jgi:transcription initiation factor TFIID subunit TAF12
MEHSADKWNLEEILTSISSRHEMSEPVKELLQEIADDFVESVTSFSCSLAKHRKSEVLEPRDIAFCLEKNWGIKVATHGSAESGAAGLQSARRQGTTLHAFREGKAREQMIKLEKESEKRIEEEKKDD